MEKKITIAEVINLVDALKPNTRSQDEKIMWLDSLDNMVKEDIFDTHEGEEVIFNGYDENTPMETELLIPAHYGREIYRYYLELQIDLVNQEYQKYNSSSALFNSAYDNYAKKYHSTHMPLQNNTVTYF